MSGSRRNNSISCLDYSSSCFQNQFWIRFEKSKTFCKRSFLIGGQEVGEIIPFPVWIILFPVFKTSFGFVFKSYKLFVKEVFLIGGQEVGEIIPFPVWIILFPVFKT